MVTVSKLAAEKFNELKAKKNYPESVMLRVMFEGVG